MRCIEMGENVIHRRTEMSGVLCDFEVLSSEENRSIQKSVGSKFWGMWDLMRSWNG